VRGIRVGEPGIDMSIGASIISSKMNKSIARDTIFIGEISLTGRIKTCFQIEKRIKEAQKLGFKKIFIPSIDIDISGVELIKIKDIAELVSKIV
jgi:DNA repair protein RadA/Sms